MSVHGRVKSSKGSRNDILFFEDVIKRRLRFIYLIDERNDFWASELTAIS